MRVELEAHTQPVNCTMEDFVAYIARIGKVKENPQKLVKYLKKHKHWCYDEETQIFTEYGWLYFRELVSDTRVAQVTNGTMDFVLPRGVYASHYAGPMILCESKTINYCVTPNHRLFGRQRKSGSGYKEWTTMDAEETYRKQKQMQTTATYAVEGEGTYAEGAYTGFMLGDGFRMNNISVGCRLKKLRKINYIRTILTVLKKQYKESVDNKGVTNFSIADASISLPKCADKILPDWHGKSGEYLHGLLEGLRESDGSIKHNGFVYSSSSKLLFEGIQTLATLCGYQMSVGCMRHTQNVKHNTNYIGTILSRHLGVVNGGLRQDEHIVQYDGNVYCVNVPSGLVLVRRKGKQLVCGNSPFEHTYVTFKIVTSRAIGRQLLRHRSFTFQEHSQRFEEAVAFEPVELRRQAESNRQSSTEVFDPIVENTPIPKSAAGAIMQHLARTQVLYRDLLEAGVARECARMILPECTQTTILMTGNLRSWIHMLALREDAHAQKEAQEIGRAIRPYLQQLFPYIFDTVEGL